MQQQERNRMYNNDDWYKNQQRNEYAIVRNRSIWQRHRWLFISLVAILLMALFASTTIYLLATRSSGTTAIAHPATPTAAIATPVPTSTTTTAPASGATPT